jgi:hypothetical protein
MSYAMITQRLYPSEKRQPRKRPVPPPPAVKGIYTPRQTSLSRLSGLEIQRQQIRRALTVQPSPGDSIEQGFLRDVPVDHKRDAVLAAEGLRPLLEQG